MDGTRNCPMMLALALALCTCGCDDKKTDDTGEDTTIDVLEDTLADSTPPDTTDEDSVVMDTGDDTVDPDVIDVVEEDVTSTDTPDEDSDALDASSEDVTEEDGSTLSCNYTSFSPATEEAVDGGSYFYYDADSSTSMPFDVLTLEFYSGSAGSIPLGTPGSYTIGTAAEDANYSTCVTCLTIAMDCDSGGCTQIFFATEGSLEITTWGSVGGQFTGTLTDAVLVEVTIDPTTWVSTPVPDGEVWCLPSHSFDVTVISE